MKGWPKPKVTDGERRKQIEHDQREEEIAQRTRLAKARLDQLRLEATLYGIKVEPSTK